MKIIDVYITSFFLLLILMSCGKEGCNVIPESSVNITISQGSNIDLTAHGNFAYFLDQGYAGVILVNLNGKVNAFDLCSTLKPSEKNRVELVNRAYFFDQYSGAKWLLDGSPAAIADCPLKAYSVTTSNNGFTYNIRY